MNINIMTLTRNLIITTFMVSVANARYLSTPVIDSVSTLFMEQKYSDAEKFLVPKISKDSSCDAIYIYLSNIQTKLLDYENYVNDTEYIEKSEDFILRLKKELQHSTTGDSTKYLFYLGNVIGARGLILAKGGNWIAGVSNAKESYSILKNVIKRDSSYYEAYLGVGVFNYYLGQNLKWIPFLKPKIEKGIEFVRHSIKTKSPFRYASVHSLLWILIDNKKYVKADSLVDEVLSIYPDNTIFLRVKQKTLMSMKQYEEAIHVSNKIIKISLERNPVNYSDMLSGYAAKIEALHKLELNKLAYESVEKALLYKIPDWAMKIEYVKKHLDYIGTMNIELKKSINRSHH